MRCGVLALAAALLLSGCSAAREPDRLALVRVLGVDGEETVTLSAAGEQRSFFGAVTAPDFEGARRILPWSGEGEELSLTGVSYVLVSESVRLEPLMLSILEDPELGGTATVWVATEECVSLLYGCEDAVADLELLSMRGISAPTVAETAAWLAQQGDVRLPQLTYHEGRLEFGEMISWKKH